MSLTNKIIVMFFWVGLWQVTAAQIKLNQGQELDIPAGAKFDRVIGSDANAFYVYRIKTIGAGTQYYVERYSKSTLNLEWSKNLRLEDIENVNLDPKRTNTFTVMGENNIHVIFPIYFKKNDSKILALKTISKDGKVTAGYKKIAGEEGRPGFSFRQTPDKSKFLIVTSTKMEKGPDKKEAVLFDADDLSVVWKEVLPGSYEKSGIIIQDYAVANDGTLAFFFIYMKDFDKEELGAAAAVMKPGESSQALNLDLKYPKEPSYLILKFTKENKLVCVGMFKDSKKYVKKTKKPRGAGFFYYLVDVNQMALEASGEDYFPASVTKQFDYKGPDGKIAGEKYFGHTSQLEEVAGNFFFLTEHSYDWVNSTSGTTTSKIRKEVIVGMINGSTGKMEWVKVLQKNSKDRSGLFNVMKHNDHLYVLCLEHPSVQKKFDAGKSYDPGKFPDVSGIGGCNVRVYDISPEGKIKGSIIYRNEDFSYEPQYQDVTLAGDNKLLIYMLKRGKEKFGTIEIR